MRLHIARRVPIKRSVSSSWIEVARLNGRYPCPRRQPGNIFRDIRPMLTAIASYLDISVVRPHPDHVTVLRRLGDRVDGFKLLRVRIVDRQTARELLMLPRRIVGRQIRRNPLPGFSVIMRAEQKLPNTQVTFDKFHVVSLVNNAVKKVRRQERKDHPELAGSRYVWLKNPENLTPSQWEKFDDLDIVNSHLKTARAYQIRLAFQDLFTQPADKAESFLDKWYFWATHSRIPAIIDVAKTIRRHQDGILRWFVSGINNAILEGINSLVQAAKAKARGYRSDRNLATIIYLIAGKLDLTRLPT